MSDKKFKDPTFTISKVYTKTGDSGKTSLVGGQKVLKSNIRINAFGEIDELNSVVGMCVEELKLINHDFSNLIESLHRVQNDLFNLGTILATEPEDMLPSMPKITIEDINFVKHLGFRIKLISESFLIDDMILLEDDEMPNLDTDLKQSENTQILEADLMTANDEEKIVDQVKQVESKAISDERLE